MKKLFFMTGTNACGKSSIAQHFLRSDPFTSEIKYPVYKALLNVSPVHNLIILGRYSKVKLSGGCDIIEKKAYTQAMLKDVWDRDEDILLEGYLIGSKVWLDELIEINQGRRELIFLYPNTTLQTCFDRIKLRSGKSLSDLKDNGGNVIRKKNRVMIIKKWLEEARPEWRVITVDTENSTPEENCEFIKNII